MKNTSRLSELSPAVLDKSSSLYIELMIKVLSASLYPQSAWKRFHIDDRNWSNTKSPTRLFKYLIKTSIYQLLQKNNLEIFHTFPFNSQQRSVGLDWPEFLGFTMIGETRLRNIVDAVYHVVKNNVRGDFLEAGVWRGGASIMMKAVSHTLGQNRKIYLADSFMGMPKAEHSKDRTDISCVDILSVSEKEVLDNFKNVNLLDDDVITVPGFFSESLCRADIPELSILRLDADMYESTLTCLNELYDKVVDGGVIILDDYFSWDSCREAFHDFSEARNIKPILVKIDQDSVYFIKQEAAT